MKHLYAIAAALFMVSTVGNAQSFTMMNEYLEDDYNSGGTVGVTDMNNDGYDDIILLDDARHLKILFQSPDGFTEMDYGVISFENQWGYAVGDINNDGHNDVISGGFYDGVHFISINPDGTMTESDLPNGSIFMQDCNMADMNNDGYLDFYACDDNAISRIWENNGDGTMSNSSIIDLFDYDYTDYPNTDHSGNYGAVWCDFDDDGDIDLYIAKCRQGVTDEMDPRRINQLWVNDGNNNYTEEALDRGLVIYKQSWTVDFADYDNDGDFDCLLTNHDSYLTLLENDGNGYFTDVSEAAGLSDTFGFFLQCKMADFDNDGWVDILYSGGIHDYLKNNGDGTFSSVSGMFPNGDTMHSFGVGDLNKDGFMDVYASYGNVYVNADYNNEDLLWMNDTNDNNWIAFDLQGVESNLNAVGAKVKIYGDFGVQVREVRAGESYGIINTFHLSFGLGQNESVDSAVIEWPSGQTTEIENPDINTYHNVFETECALTAEVVAEGPTTICPGETVVINAPEGYTYQWNNGATGQTIEVSETGFYNVIVNDGTCYGSSNTIEVIVTQPVLPTITVNGELAFCEGGSVELISSSADSYEWSNGDDSQVLTVTESGAYTVSVPGECANDLESEMIVVEVFDTPDTPVVDDESIDNPGTVTLSGSGNELHWYENEDDVDPIFVGNSFETPFLNSSETFWVEDVITYGGVEANGGQAANDVANGDYFNNQDRYLIFDANEDIVLNSVKVYADNAGIRTIGVVDQFGVTLASGDFDIPAGESVVVLDFFVPAGTNHQLRALSNNPGLWRDAPPTPLAYPYDLGGLATITTSSVQGENALNYYYFFYDWNVSTPSWECVSDRVEVTVTIVGVEEIDGLESFNVFPNPVVQNATVSFELTSQKDVIMTLTDVAGRTVINQQLTTAVGVNRHEVNVAELAEGIYNLQLQIEGQAINTKLIVK